MQCGTVQRIAVAQWQNVDGVRRETTEENEYHMLGGPIDVVI